MDDNPEFIGAKGDDLCSTPVVGVFTLIRVILAGAFRREKSLGLWFSGLRGVHD